MQTKPMLAKNSANVIVFIDGLAVRFEAPKGAAINYRTRFYTFMVKV